MNSVEKIKERISAVRPQLNGLYQVLDGMTKIMIVSLDKGELEEWYENLSKLKNGYDDFMGGVYENGEEELLDKFIAQVDEINETTQRIYSKAATYSGQIPKENTGLKLLIAELDKAAFQMQETLNLDNENFQKTRMGLGGFELN